MNATAVIPVKRFGAAKQRLLDAIDPPARAAIVKAMLTDVLTAATACRAVDRVIVVTGEGRAEKIALATSQRVSTPIEVMRDPEDAGHSQAATLGIVRAKALGAECVVLLPGDCPLLETAELQAALDRAEHGRVTVVPDRHGTGTNALILSPPDAIAPGFGPGSRERHAERAKQRGLETAVEELGSLALDLDTPDDLRALAEVLAADSERASATAAELSRLDLP